MQAWCSAVACVLDVLRRLAGVSIGMPLLCIWLDITRILLQVDSYSVPKNGRINAVERAQPFERARGSSTLCGATCSYNDDFVLKP
jgi:hypothetical protein